MGEDPTSEIKVSMVYRPKNMPEPCC